MAKSRRTVFISSAASDALVARELATQLQAAGVDTWNATTEALPGANLSAELGRALDRADALIVLISPAAVKSSMVLHEIQFALGQEKLQDRLIPVMVKQTPTDDIPWILRTLQWAKGGADKVTDQVLKALDAPKRREARAAAR
jgi:hypothetical protein